jgi:hypothetical protein
VKERLYENGKGRKNERGNETEDTVGNRKK